MNSAMGFGIVTSGALSGLAFATPAGAHHSPPIETQYGRVLVYGAGHNWITTTDHACGDGFTVYSQYKLDDGSGVVRGQHPGCDGVSDEGNFGHPIAGFRKCHIETSSQLRSCGEWRAP